jgi:hypothetical protein
MNCEELGKSKTINTASFKDLPVNLSSDDSRE